VAAVTDGHTNVDPSLLDNDTRELIGREDEQVTVLLAASEATLDRLGRTERGVEILADRAGDEEGR